MKTNILLGAALAVAFLATSAYGQQHRQVHAPQHNWAVPIVKASSVQEPALQVQSNAAPAPNMQGVYSPAVGDSCGCGSACGDQCGGRQGGLRGRLQGMGRGASDDCNTCGPEKYLTVFGGASNFNDIGLTLGLTDPAGAPQGFDALLNQNNGWTIGGGIGRRLMSRVRGEVEWSYRNASLNTAEVTNNGVPQGTFDLDGQLNIYRSTTNLLFDLNPGGRFNLYCGGGVGVGFIDLDAQEATQPVQARLETSSFIYQGIAGMSAKVNSRAEIYVDYRYFGTDHFEINATSPIGGSNTSIDITSNDVIVGLRFWR